MQTETPSGTENLTGDESVTELVRKLDPSMRIRWLLTNFVGLCLAVVIGYFIDFVRAIINGSLAPDGFSLSFFFPVAIDEEMMRTGMSWLAVLIVALSLRGTGNAKTRLEIAHEGRIDDRLANLSLLAGSLAAFLSVGYVASWFGSPMTPGPPTDADIVSAALMLTLSQALVALTAVRGVSLRQRAEQARSSLAGFEKWSSDRAERWSGIWGPIPDERAGSHREPAVSVLTLVALCVSIGILLAVPALLAGLLVSAGPNTQVVGAGSLVILLLMFAFLSIKIGFATSARRTPRPVELVMIVFVLVVFGAPAVLVMGRSIDNWPWWAMGAALTVHSLRIFLKREGTPAGLYRKPRPAIYLWSPLAMERLYVGLVHGAEDGRRKAAKRYVDIHRQLISTVDRMGKTDEDATDGRSLRIELVWGRGRGAGRHYVGGRAAPGVPLGACRPEAGQAIMPTVPWFKRCEPSYAVVPADAPAG